MVMIGVARRLSADPRVCYTIYADDITLWVPGGSNGHIEEVLQTAVYAIEDYLMDTGLRCSPQKSELLLVPPPGRYRKKGEEDSRVITVRTRDGTVIPRVTTLRVLGMYLEASRCNGTSADRIVTKVGIATRLIKRLATKHSGMKEASLLRLIQSFAMSHVAYTGAFHPWKQPERDKINAAIRKTYKTALGLLASTSTERLLELGLHNTLEEVSEAQRTAQLERLSTTVAGREILARVGYNLQEEQESSKTPRLPQPVRERLRILPLPRNIHPDHNRGRREARARALTETHANDTGALYVDAAQYPDRKDTYVAVAVKATTGELYSACSVRAKRTCQAEETAIALALTGAGCTTILSDSRTAITNFLKDSVCASAVRMLQCSVGSSAPKTVTTVRWFPAHAGAGASGSGFPNRNETADAVARELTGRAAPPRDSQAAEGRPEELEMEPLVAYGDILQWYRAGRRLRPPPHPRLSREDAVLYRQLQTNSVLTPMLARHVCPEVYESVLCSVCNVSCATLAHLLWDCELNPVEASASKDLPARTTSAMNTYDPDVQAQEIQRLKAALARQRRREVPARALGASTPRARGNRPRGSQRALALRTT